MYQESIVVSDNHDAAGFFLFTQLIVTKNLGFYSDLSLISLNSRSVWRFRP